MSFDHNTLNILADALKVLEKGFADLPVMQLPDDSNRIRQVLLDVAEKMQDNYPYHHPMYAGQMLKPPHPVARLAYMLAMWINPNNHALDGGKASSAMEIEAVAGLAAMFRLDRHLGHLTGGGTMANLEGLWVAGKLHPDKYVAASNMAHYTHSRITEVLKIPFMAIDTNQTGQIDLNHLEDELKTGRIGTVVANIGTTGTGSVDPLDEIIGLRKKYPFRIHADAAYGGYFTLCDNISGGTRKAYDALSKADSIVIDPHKHGLQPYGCGCILFTDPAVGRFYKHDSPYTYFTSGDLHLGEISLECSRAGASAVALWATMQMLPLTTGGEFAQRLEKSRSAALGLYDRLNNDPDFITIMAPELDIIVWAPKAEKISLISDKSTRLFDLAALKDLHLAMFNYPVRLLPESWQNIEKDQDTVTCLRSALMKPEHFDWQDKIWHIIKNCSDEIS